MAISVYIAGNNNKISGISHAYAKTGQHIVQASNNITQTQFTSSITNADQAKLYTSISFGSNVTSIPDRCCYNFINLQIASFSGSKVTFIGDEAFYGCQQLQSITIPEKVTAIGSNAFSGCIRLASATFPKSAVNIGEKAFYSSHITSLNVVLGNSSGNEIFSQCTSLNTATIDGRLCVGMFTNCTALKSAYVKCSTDSIPNACFKGCSSLETVQFSNIKLVEYIDDDAFSGCSSLNAFNFESTSVKHIGQNAFAGTKIQSIVLPETITSPSQLNSSFLGGSSVTYVKFKGINSAYMDANPTSFSSFGGNAASMTLESSDGKKYKIDMNGLVIGNPTIVPAGIPVYIISVAISNNLENNPLVGMYKDSQRFIDLVKQAYADNPDMIVGITRLNDNGITGSDGLGTEANIDKAFEKAKSAGAKYVIFHFSDHGERKNSWSDGYMYLYNGYYTYEKLYSKLYDFDYAFVLLCCCYPNSTKTTFKPGAKNTKAVFWCAGATGEITLMHRNVGHDFLTRLVKKFNAEYTWEEQWNQISAKYSKLNTTPHQYVYGQFPTKDKVFTVT